MHRVGSEIFENSTNGDFKIKLFEIDKNPTRNFADSLRLAAYVQFISQKNTYRDLLSIAIRLRYFSKIF